MRHKDANLHLAKKRFQKAAQNPGQSTQADVTVFVYREQGSADAPHKDANLHLVKKCGTGFQKAAQNPEQSNLADVYLVIKKNGHRGSADALQGCKPALDQEVRRWFPQSSSVSARCHGICSADAPQGCKPALDQAFKARQSSADAPQGCKLALDQEVRHWLPKSSSVSAVFVYRNQLRLGRALLMRHKDANLHLTKKCCAGFQKAISRMSLYICFLSRNIDILQARQGPAGAPQGCKPALDQEVRRWLLKSSSVSGAKQASRMSRFVFVYREKIRPTCPFPVAQHCCKWFLLTCRIYVSSLTLASCCHVSPREPKGAEGSRTPVTGCQASQLSLKTG